MDATTEKLNSLLENLDDEIDDLEEALAPLLKPVLAETASKYPLLDKAKLYVSVTYAIESMLFSYLRLNGVNAREHAVFKELTRVKQYFEKLKNAENPVGKRENLTLDKSAAARIVKAGLAGNDSKDDGWQKEKENERARAHIKFEELTEKIKQDELSKKRKAEDPGKEDSSSDSGSDSSADSPKQSDGPKKKQKQQSSSSQSLPTSGVSSSSETKKPKKKNKKKSKKNKGKKSQA